MPASSAFVDGLLDVVDKHISAFVGNNMAKLEFCRDIVKIPGNNESVRKTQTAIAQAALKRWHS